MLRLLSSDYNNSWSMVCANMIGNHALPVVIILSQQLEHGLCQYYRKPCFVWCNQTITTAGTWALSVIRNHVPPVVIRL